MRKIVLALVAAATVATSFVGPTFEAKAGNEAGAFLGGLVGGAIIGGAIQQSQQPRYVQPQRYYGDDEVVVVRRPRCRDRLVEDQYGRQFYQRVCR